MRTIQLSGGGLDSTALSVLYPTDVVVCWYYGQTMFEQEFNACLNFRPDALRMTASDQLINLNPRSLLFGTGEEPFILGRNLSLIYETAMRFVKEEPITIVLGLCKEGMMFSDADPNFVNLANELFSVAFGSIDGTPRVSVIAPYIDTPKLDYMLQAYSVVGDDLWNKSFTCWTPSESGEECGVCYHCVKKKKLMEEVYAITR